MDRGSRVKRGILVALEFQTVKRSRATPKINLKVVRQIAGWTAAGNDLRGNPLHLISVTEIKRHYVLTGVGIWPYGYLMADATVCIALVGSGDPDLHRIRKGDLTPTTFLSIGTQVSRLVAR